MEKGRPIRLQTDGDAKRQRVAPTNDWQQLRFRHMALTGEAEPPGERSKREYLDDVSDVEGWLESRCSIRSVTAVRHQYLAGFLADCLVSGHAGSMCRCRVHLLHRCVSR